jgi:3-oxoacyl-[acyl-carrier-protein] synthase-3
MITAAITGLSHYLPDYVLTNDEIATMVDTNDEWITTRTGIKSRRVLKDEHAGSSQLAIPAVRDVLEKTGTAPEEVECLICATSSPDYTWPSTACIIADALNIRNAMCYDILSACSGFLYCLQQAQAFIKSGIYKKIIICSAEKCTSFINYKDRTTCALFGDGGAAALIEPNEEGYGVLVSKIHSDGAGNDHLIRLCGGSANIPSHEAVDAGMHFIHQDGKFVFKNAVTFMTSAVTEVMEEGNLTLDDIDWICTHQANKRIIDAVRQHCKAPEEKVICNIEHVGNTSSASIPIALHEAALEGKLKKGDRLLLAAFGSGFTWGAMYVKWGDCKI